MPPTAQAATPLAVEVIHLDNLALANSGYQVVAQDLVQLQSQPLKARQVIIRLEGCMVVYQSTNLRLRTRPTLLKNYVGYVTFGPHASGTANGLKVRNDIMLAVPPSASIGMVVEPDYESVAFFLSPEDVRQHLSVRNMGDSVRLPTEVEVLHVGAELAGRLFVWGKTLVETAAEHPEMFNDSMEQRVAAQADLVDTLLTTLSSTRKLKPEKAERTRQVQSEIVRAAERHALANADRRLFVTDLCSAACVSERTLEYAFRAVMNLSPKAYLARIRLHRVHHALLIARPGSTTVTEEALNWGFWHFGEFSRAYKDCFNELPSETLRRSSELRG